MLLREFFPANGKMLSSLRQMVMDFLTPFVAREVEVVDINDIEAALNEFRSGLTVDRALVMQILDPTTMKLIKKIEGDKVYLSAVAAMTSSNNKEDAEREVERLHDKAASQAKKNIKKGA